MRIFIINLKKSRYRRKSISQQLDLLRLEYEFFDAVDGSILGNEELSSLYNKKWAKRHVGRPLLPGEIGCALSHIGIYRKIVKEKIPYALVLEDDTQLLPSIVQGLKKLELILAPEEAVVCLLSGCAGMINDLGTLGEGYHLRRIASAAYLAHAYVVSYEAAQRLISALFPVVQVADDWGWISHHANVELYASDPEMASQLNEQYFESTIDTTIERKKHQMGRWTSLKWYRNRIYLKWWQFVERIGLGYYFWKNF